VGASEGKGGMAYAKISFTFMPCALQPVSPHPQAPFLPLFPVTGYVAEKSASPTPTRGLSAPAGSSQIGNRSLFPPSIPPSSPPVALTRLAWTGDGKRLAVGDTSGRIHVLRMAEEVRERERKAGRGPGHEGWNDWRARSSQRHEGEELLVSRCLISDFLGLFLAYQASKR
jgi:hypothetical protein